MARVYDILIAGGGIMGLWAARCARLAGLRVYLAERAQCGSGASGGPLGALLPHLPDAASDKRRFQWQALHDLGGLIAELEDETGFSTGYARTGRLTPIRRETFLAKAAKCVSGADAAWRFGEAAYAVDMLGPEDASKLLPCQSVPLGALHDSMSAKVHPGRYVAALKAGLTIDADVGGHVEIHEGVGVTGWDGRQKRAALSNGHTIAADKLLMAAGVPGFELLETMTGRNYGHGVKGHAVIYRRALPDTFPVIYDDGVYIVPHDTATAIGSTSDTAYDDPTSVDAARIAQIVQRAEALVPSLQHMRSTQLWANVRPRAAAKDPIVGCLDSEQGIWALTGGYKISFGIAHRCAQALIEDITSAAPTVTLPATYRAVHHLEQAAA